MQVSESTLGSLAAKSGGLKRLRILYSSSMGISAISTWTDFIVNVNKENAVALEEIRLWKFSQLANHGTSILESMLANGNMHSSLSMLDLRLNSSWWASEDEEDEMLNDNI